MTFDMNDPPDFMQDFNEQNTGFQEKSILLKKLLLFKKNELTENSLCTS